MTQALSYQDFLARLDALGLFHMDLSLGRMEEFVRRSGLPRFPVLHVVGTNGKGSTATLLAELLRAHGLRVGLSVSPHFVTPRERILVDGRMLPEETWARLGARVFELSEGIGLTYFEVLTALALLAFEEAGAQVAVMEAGLGGRYDATNVLSPALTVFTPMGLDHINVLGPTLTHIARDKAGAMRPGGLALTAGQDSEAMEVLTAEAQSLGATLLRTGDVLSYNRNSGELKPARSASARALAHLSVRPMKGLRLGLAGRHQGDNAATALAAFHLFAARHRLPVHEDACRAALAKAFIPGRMQMVEARPDLPGLPGRLILDGGHNAHGLAALAASLRSANIWPGAVVFGCLRDKPVHEMLPLVRAIAGLERGGRLMACGIPGCQRALSGPELAELLGPGAEAHAEVNKALEAAAAVPGPVLVCGSLYLLGEFYTKHPQLLERPA